MPCALLLPVLSRRKNLRSPTPAAIRARRERSLPLSKTCQRPSGGHFALLVKSAHLNSYTLNSWILLSNYSYNRRFAEHCFSNSPLSTRALRLVFDGSIVTAVTNTVAAGNQYGFSPSFALDWP